MTIRTMTSCVCLARRWAAVTLGFSASALAMWGVLPEPASAQSGQAIEHVVRAGETLKSISELYYGDKRDNVVAMENALGSGTNVVPGMRLTIPTVLYHRVSEGETWAELAERYYADVRRAFVLVDANAGKSSKPPEPGVLLLIPYPLRYVSSAHDPVRQAARDFYDGSTKAIAMLRRFNGVKGAARSVRGEILLLPMPNLVLSDEGRKQAQAHGTLLAASAAARSQQLSAQEALPELRQHVLEGRYVEAVALANQLLAQGELTGNQLVTIQRELGTALIALDRDDLALEAFKALLEQQPDVELGLGDTSPRVLKILDRARRALGDKVAPVAGRKSSVTVSTTP